MLTYRKEALDALRASEDLDEAIRVTSPYAWVFALGLCATIAVTLTWSVLGSIPVRVEGPAQISYAGARTSEVVALESGLLMEILVELGDRVAEGQVIARTRNEVLRAELSEEERSRDKQHIMLKDYRDQQLAEISEFQALAELKKKALETRLSDAREDEAFHKSRLEDTRDLRKRGFTTEAAVDEARDRLHQVSDSIGKIVGDAVELDLSLVERQNQWRQRILDQQNRLLQQEGTLATLRERLKLAEELRAPIDGEIESIVAAQGNFLQPGEKIASVVGPANPDLEVLAFLQPGDAKQVTAGMRAQVAASSAPREEYGAILGIVTEVETFPMSTDALSALLQNRDLADAFTRDGAPILVRIALDEDVDGTMRWSTGTDPEIRITAGTTAQVTVVVKTHMPIEFVLPALRRWSGL